MKLKEKQANLESEEFGWNSIKIWIRYGNLFYLSWG